MRGVPVRVELGPKDVAKQSAMLARRDKPGKEGKVSAPLADLAGTIEKLLADIHQSMFDKALAFRRANTREVQNYDEFKAAVENGFAFAFWCGNDECEEKVKEETRATMRCIPLDPASVLGHAGSGSAGTCIYCDKPAKERALFARAY
jgi:prolyl-tRNA synthetase